MQRGRCDEGTVFNLNFYMWLVVSVLKSEALEKSLKRVNHMIKKLMEGKNEIILQTCFIYNKTRKEKKQQRINEMRTTKASS